MTRQSKDVPPMPYITAFVPHEENCNAGIFQGRGAKAILGDRQFNTDADGLRLGYSLTGDGKRQKKKVKRLPTPLRQKDGRFLVKLHEDCGGTALMHPLREEQPLRLLARECRPNKPLVIFLTRHCHQRFQGKEDTLHGRLWVGHPNDDQAADCRTRSNHLIFTPVR